jgi:choline kinase
MKLPQQKQSNIGVIIPAAGMGRRMKSYGPKPLIKIGNSTILKNQISLLQTHIGPTTLVLVCGFKATTLMNETPEYILKIENERYEDTNVARSIGLGLRVVATASKVIVVYGDLVFNSAALKDLDCKESSIVIAGPDMGENEVGCIIDDKNQQLSNLMYDLPYKWGQMAVFMDKELELLKRLCWDEKNYTKFGFEIINQILYKGGSFKCIQNPNIKIIDIDNSKDIEKAKEILL